MQSCTRSHRPDGVSPINYLPRHIVSLFALGLAFTGPPASAGETPLYEPSPSWISSVPDAKDALTASSGGALIVYDVQQRIDGATLWQYVDSAVHITSPELLAKYTNVAFNWFPDKGDLTVHELSFLRGGQIIDLLAAGKRLDVLRREAKLEQHQLTGILTATAQIDGLRMGDVVRVRYSTSLRDDAIGGNVQAIIPLLAKPVNLGSGRVRTIWPADKQISWRLNAEAAEPKPQRKGGHIELVIPLPLAKQPEMPEDAPLRFRHPPQAEFSSFADWHDVSRTMAPIYATDGLIRNDSPLAAEVHRIANAASSDLERTQSALRLVQDKIRYLAVGMNGGNYVPQTPTDTWQLRYGDCKAKTLMLLAMLHAMNIEAEPVLASTELGDMVPERLPSLAAFNHILVRVIIEEREHWLDGTSSGSRIEDIGDTPPFGYVLPVRMAGAELHDISMRPNARPMMVLTAEVDESSSPDLPSVFDATVVVRGEMASGIEIIRSGLDSQKQEDVIRQFFVGVFGQAQFSKVSMKSDPVAGTVTLRATGITTTSWKNKDNRLVRRLGKLMGEIEFRPDRAKREWHQIPIATPRPQGFRYKLTLRLPDGGSGYTLEGDDRTAGIIAGRHVTRSASLSGGTVLIEERVDTTGLEITPEDLPAARKAYAVARSIEPKVRAPTNATRRWDLPNGRHSGTQLARVKAVYKKAIADNPDEDAPYLGRASFRKGIGDLAGARTDLTAALHISAKSKTYLDRAWISRALGDLERAINDARKAHEIDPTKKAAVILLADLQAETGNLTESVDMLDELIGLGSEEREAYELAKIGVIGEFGDPATALALLEDMKRKKPNNPSLLNTGCWIRGMRSFNTETALGGCTRAIELSSSPMPALDSRSLIWFRNGHYEDALADLNAVLDQAPGLAESRLMRSIVLTVLGRPEDARRDRLIAETIDPGVLRRYRRYGLLP